MVSSHCERFILESIFLIENNINLIILSEIIFKYTELQYVTLISKNNNNNIQRYSFFLLNNYFSFLHNIIFILLTNIISIFFILVIIVFKHFLNLLIFSIIIFELNFISFPIQIDPFYNWKLRLHSGDWYSY